MSVPYFVMSDYIRFTYYTKASTGDIMALFTQYAD